MPSKDPYMTPKPEPVNARGDWARAEDGDSTYRIAGKDYVRMTTILGTYTSPRIQMYYGKTAALSAIEPLIHCGLIQSEHLPEMAGTASPEYDAWDTLEQIVDTHDESYWEATMKEIVRYIDARAIQKLPPHEAVLKSIDWQFHMRAGERYRDHKGRIGRIAHHCLYDHAIGLRVRPLDMLDYLRSKVDDLIRWPADMLERYAALGVDEAGLRDDLCHHAMPHARNVYQFIEDFKPEWITIGLEACVYSADEEWAGTKDGGAFYTKANWEAACQARSRRKVSTPPWRFPMERAALINDLKTSNFLADSVRYQLAGYARADAIVLMKEQSFHDVPDYDGMFALHSVPGSEMAMKLWGDLPDMTGKEIIDRYYEDFCSLNAFYRSHNDLPRALRSRRYAQPKPKRGERPVGW